MFLNVDFELGIYMRFVYNEAIKKGCSLDRLKVKSLGNIILHGFERGNCDEMGEGGQYMFLTCSDFDNNYLFSDACSLYYKGINIFPDIFGDKWRKYVPVESHKEIVRQCNKFLNLNANG